MKRTNKTAVAWLSTAHLVNDTYSGFLNPIMPFIAAKIGISMAIATVVISISHIFSSLLQPVFGYFADNILKRAFIFWGLIMISIFIPLAPAMPNVYLLTICTVIGSLGSSFFHPQGSGFIAKFSNIDFSKNVAIFISLGSIGFSLGPLLAAVVTQWFGMEKMPYTSLVGLMLAIVMFKCVPKLSNVEKKPEHKHFVESFKRILANKKLRILIVISMMKSLITNSNSILLPFLWKDMGYSPLYIGGALFLFIFMGGVGSLFSRWLEKKVGTKPIFYLSMIGTLPLMLLFIATYQNHPVLSLIIFVATGFVTMLAMPITMVMAQNIMPDLKSIIAGFINGFSWGSIALCMSVIGFVAQAYGIPQVLCVLAFVPAVCSCLVKHLDLKDV